MQKRDFGSYILKTNINPYKTDFYYFKYGALAVCLFISLFLANNSKNWFLAQKQILITKMHLQIFDCNSKYNVYNFYDFSIKKEKMWYMTFLIKAVTVWFRKIAGFDYKNSHRFNKLTIFQLNTISKINFRILVVISYISWGLRSRKAQLVWKVFK